MTKQIINIGRTANDRSGDPLRTAFEKVNDNFAELTMLSQKELDNLGLKVLAHMTLLLLMALLVMKKLG
jgi:hypothetical protein